MVGGARGGKVNKLFFGRRGGRVKAGNVLVEGCCGREGKGNVVEAEGGIVDVGAIGKLKMSVPWGGGSTDISVSSVG